MLQQVCHLQPNNFEYMKRNVKYISNKMNNLHCNRKFKLMNDDQQRVKYFAPSNN
jgi:hypothetical protein